MLSLLVVAFIVWLQCHKQYLSQSHSVDFIATQPQTVSEYLSQLLVLVALIMWLHCHKQYRLSQSHSVDFVATLSHSDKHYLSI